MENIISTEICETCAKCCKNFPFVKLSKIEINSLVHKSGLHFNVFAYPIGNALEEYFIQFQDNGDCFFLNKNNCIYSCGVYDARPGICKNYPSKPSQHKVCNADRNKCCT